MTKPKHNIKDLGTEAPRWCVGCGDFGILMALKKTMVDLELSPDETVHVSGIGCSGRTPNYIRAYGVHGIHGRAIPIATGLALTRPELNVFVESGDGDALSIGGNHLLHGIHKNINCTFLLYNNELYALTKSQSSPTTRQGYQTTSQPRGTYLDPINPIRLVLGMGATFVVNTADWLSDHLGQALRLAVAHEGFSFVHIFQRCPHYDPCAFDHKSTEWLTFLTHENGMAADKKLAGKASEEVHDPQDLQRAFAVAEHFKSHLGLIYHDPSRRSYDDILRQQTAEATAKNPNSLLDRYRL